MGLCIEPQQLQHHFADLKRRHIAFGYRDCAGIWSDEFFTSNTSRLFQVKRSHTYCADFLQRQVADGEAAFNNRTGIKLNKYLPWRGNLHSVFGIVPSQTTSTLKSR
jgi:hypothetical protein